MIEVAGNQISTGKIAIKDCFYSDMWYSVPEYQRPYVWEEEQIISLLDDIELASNSNPNSQYFLGSMVLHCQTKTKDDTDYVENAILDGQQRLTTLYLLHAVIRDITDITKRKSSCQETIYQEGDPDNGIPERLRLEFSIRPEVDEFFNTNVKKHGSTLENEDLDNTIKSSKSISVRNLAKAILIIRSWFKKNEQPIDLDTFYGFLRQNVVLVYVASAELEDAFQMFTVLNDRGIKLRNSDILKALNLKEISNEKEREKYARFWEELEGELGEEFDKFLSYIRTILVKEKARHSLLKEYEENIYNPRTFNKSSKEYVQIQPLLNKGIQTFQYIENYKSHYNQIFGGNNFYLEKNWAFDNLISILHETTFSDIWIPPLLAYKKNVGEFKIYSFLRKLDVKFSGDWISKESPTIRQENMNKIIIQIENACMNLHSKEEMATSILESDVFEFNKKEFLDQIENNTTYGRRYARYLLCKIDFFLSGPNHGEKRDISHNMSIEHVLPQNPEENSDWKTIFSNEELETYKHRLGNLVLISRRKNTQLSNLDFVQKKEKYFRNNIETFPNSSTVMQKESWTPSDVTENHDKLVNLIDENY